MVERNKRKQIWADKNFVLELEKIKARSVLEGKPIRSIPNLTKEIIETESFKDVVKEILNDTKIQLNIKFDKKKL